MFAHTPGVGAADLGQGQAGSGTHCLLRQGRQSAHSSHELGDGRPQLHTPQGCDLIFMQRKTAVALKLKYSGAIRSVSLQFTWPTAASPERC